MLLGKQYYTLNGSYHLFFNLPRCDLFVSLRNHKTQSPNWNFFYVWFYWFHKKLLHWFVPTLFLASNLSSYNFSNSIILAISTLVGSTSLLSPLIVDKTYSIGIEDVDHKLTSKVCMMLPPYKLSYMKMKLWIDVHPSLFSSHWFIWSIIYQ